MKRWVVIAVLFAVGGLLVAGGAKEGKQSAALKWWHHQPLDNPSGILFKKLLQEFQQANPEITVTMESIPHAQYIKSLPAAFAAGEMPDVYGMSYRDQYKYFESGTMSAIDEKTAQAMGYGSLAQMVGDWSPGALETYQINGNYYGLPWEFNIYAWVINTKHFRDAGLDPEKDYPKTWDDVHAIGQKLVQKQGGRITRQALSFPFSKADAWYMLEMEPIIRSFGGSIMNNDETKCLINSEAGIKTMQLIKKRFELGISDRVIANSITYDEDAFPTGKFSMGIGGNWGPPRWYKSFPKDTKEGDFLSIPYPTVKPGDPPPISTTSWAWVISSKSKYKLQAWKFADYITKDASRYILETGNIIPRKGWSTSPGGKNIPQASFWEKMLQYAKPLVAFKKSPEITQPLQRAMQAILLNDADIKTTLDAVKLEIDKAVSN